MPRANNRKSLFSGGEEIPHTCTGTKSSQIDNASFYLNKEEGNFHSCQNGHHGSPFLSNENGSHKNQELVTIRKEIWYYCRVPEKMNVEANRGTQEFKGSREWKMDPHRFRKICLAWGNPDIDLFATRVSHQIPQYMLWKLEPFSKGSGCIPNKLESNLCLRFPPFGSNRESTVASSTISSFHDLNNSKIANAVMVLRVTSHVSKNCPIAFRNKRYFEISLRELAYIDSTSGLGYLRKKLQKDVVQKMPQDLIPNSQGTGSLKHYESAWGK